MEPNPPLSPEEMHSAGAIIQHRSPFEGLEHFQYPGEMTTEFISKWVLPFYMWNPIQTDPVLAAYQKVRNEISKEVMDQLLGEFNWRPRIVGAYFAAIERDVDYEDIIGVHLLKSQVCYAGGGYALALASFGTEKSIDYLKQYLGYYLSRKDLEYDQRDVFAALMWLDRQKGTNHAREFQASWMAFIGEKGSFAMDGTVEWFAKWMEAIGRVRTG